MRSWAEVLLDRQGVATVVAELIDANQRPGRTFELVSGSIPIAEAGLS